MAYIYGLNNNKTTTHDRSELCVFIKPYGIKYWEAPAEAPDRMEIRAAQLAI